MKRNQFKINVRQPLQKLTVRTLVEIPEEYLNIVKDEVNIKEIVRDQTAEADVVLDTTITSLLKAEGDVRNLMRAIQDARKEKGLTPKDSVVLMTDYALSEHYRTDLMNTCKVSAIEAGTGPYTAEASSGKILFDIR